MDLGHFDTVLRREDALPTEEEGLERIGSGNNRIVFRIIDDSFVAASVEGMVLKRAYPYVDENQRERTIWSTVRGTQYESYFVPVVAAAEDNLWVLMPYAEEPSHVLDERIQTLRDVFDGRDISHSDFGVYEGESRCYDYGSCHVPDDL